MTKLSELKELCEKETREFWIHASYSCGQGGWDYQVSDKEPKYHRDEKYYVIEKSPATDPETVLKLIETIEKMRVALETIKEETAQAETTMEANAFYLAEQALEWVKGEK